VAEQHSRTKNKGNHRRLEELFGRMLSPFERFLRRTTAGGIILVGTTVFALILANSGWGDAIHRAWETTARIGIGPWQLELSVHSWVNEGLMALFFLLVGLELKREILVGELSSFREAVLPVVAAAGGMIAPALLYHVVNPDGPAAHGWGIPMATDIAFAVGILVLLAWRIPPGLIVFLTALAIADDLGAVLVIAVFYTRELVPVALGGAGGVLVVLALLNRGGIRHPLPYGLLGLLLWFMLLKSGIHPTIAGVLLAFSIPARPACTLEQLDDRLGQLHRKLREGLADGDACGSTLACPVLATVAENLEENARSVQSPQQRIEHALHPWVTFGVIPLFAMSNMGIDFRSMNFLDNLYEPVTLGVMLGLVFGKFIGISGFSWAAVKLGVCNLPSGVGWRHLLGVAWLAGIGFTMSLFIGQLAFDSPVLVERARLGILAASVVSAVLGLTWLCIGYRVQSSAARMGRTGDARK